MFTVFKLSKILILSISLLTKKIKPHLSPEVEFCPRGNSTSGLGISPELAYANSYEIMRCKHLSEIYLWS